MWNAGNMSKCLQDGQMSGKGMMGDPQLCVAIPETIS